MLPQLETDRLVLRELSLEDGPAFQAFQSREAHWRHQAVEPRDFADVLARVRGYLQHRGEGNGRRLYVYVAILKAEGRLIGDAGLSRISPAAASLGIGLDEAYVGRGLATEFAARMLAFGFENLKLHRIEADVALENAACIRLLERIGMTREGVLRESIWAQGRWWTEAKYAMLDYECRRLAGNRSEVPAAVLTPSCSGAAS